MDSKKFKNIAFYTSCDELPMHNWINLHKKKDKPNLLWLIYGYNGFNFKGYKVKEELETIYENILDEYERISLNKSSEDYLELILDINKQEERISVVSTLLYTLSRNPFRTDESKKKFAYELKRWRFFFNVENDFNDELKKMERQLKAVKMKLNVMVSDKELIEKGLKSDKIPVRKLKQRIESIERRTIDFRVMTLSEWVYTLQDLQTKKKTA